MIVNEEKKFTPDALSVGSCLVQINKYRYVFFDQKVFYNIDTSSDISIIKNQNFQNNIFFKRIFLCGELTVDF